MRPELKLRVKHLESVNMIGSKFCFLLNVLLRKTHARCLVDQQQRLDPPEVPEGKAVRGQVAPSCRIANFDLVLLPERRCCLCC